MSLTTVLILAFVPWMMFMHLRQRWNAGHCGGCRGQVREDGEPNGGR